MSNLGLDRLAADLGVKVGNGMELKAYMPYRIAYNAENRDLAGKAVVFYEIQVAGAYRRARVRLMNPDGSTENQSDWYVWPSLLIEL